MDDFSKIYEKLIDMGFTSISIDSIIELGFYTFDDIFNALVDKEPSLSKSQVTGPSFFHQNCDITDNSVTTVTDNECKYPRQKLSDGDTLSPDESDKHSGTHSRKRFEDLEQRKYEVVTNYSRVGSSPLTSSSVLSGTILESSAKNMTKIQIMDLLDPSRQPHTYSQPFLGTMCSVRDIICWFSEVRNTGGVDTLPPHTSTSKVAIPAGTDMYTLISLFEDLKWHLVLPSGATSQRIYGRDNIDKYLDQLGLVPSAHLLAIVGCPLHLRLDQSLSLAHSPSHSLAHSPPHSLAHSLAHSPPHSLAHSPPHSPTHSHSPFINNSSSAITEHCTVHIRMINYRHNPLYLHGQSFFKHKYDLDFTSLQNVIDDFAQFCDRDLSSFMFLRMHPSRLFSSTDDFHRSLRDLAFAGTVTLYCHSPTSSSHSHSAINTRSLSVDEWNAVVEADDNNSNDANVTSFPGIGQALPRSSGPTKSVREVWGQCCVVPVVGDGAAVSHNVRALSHLCLTTLYRSVKQYNVTVCRSVRRLPSGVQQALIRRLVEERSLTSTILSHFCTAGSALTVLDLAHTAQCTNELLRTIARCSGLQELILDQEDHLFTNEGLWHLRGCTNLRRLSLNHCGRIGDWGARVVTELPRLAVLGLRCTAVTDAYLADLVARTAPPLAALDLSGLASITDRSLPHLAIFADHLQSLSLASTAITDVAVTLPRLPLLEHLDLSHCSRLRWHSPLDSLCHSLPSLASIAVQDTDPDNLATLVQTLALCVNLRRLDGLLDHPCMTAAMLAGLAHLPLDSITLADLAHVNDRWLPVLATFARSLTSLVLSGCPAVTGHDDALVRHLGRLSNLAWLDLTRLDNVDSQQILRLVLGPHFPRMHVVWISLTEQQEAQLVADHRHLSFKMHVTRAACPRSIPR